MLRLFAIVAAFLVAACGEEKPLITVTQARVIGTPASAAAYFTLNNSGGADRLMAVETPGVGQASLHETSMEGGIMRMRPVTGGVEVGKGQAVRFSPYGRHIMIMLDRPIDPAKPVTLKLVFERQGAVMVDAAIQTPGGER